MITHGTRNKPDRDYVRKEANLEQQNRVTTMQEMKM
uniref:Uncharacterized protein n=1 Tax=Triticum urartu TaxID=4572 RepID=A0A8R7Q2N8_TRIUA